MRPALLRTLLAALAAVLLAAPEGARAEGEDLKPPLVGMHEVQDRFGVLSLRLPAQCRDQGPMPEAKDELARIAVRVEPDGGPDRPNLSLFLRSIPECSRAALAYRRIAHKMMGVAEPGTERTGDGWFQEERFDEKQGHVYVVRMVESQGQVFEVAASVPKIRRDRYAKHIDLILDSVKALKPDPRWAPEAPLAPAPSASGPCDVWTDSKDRKALKRLLDLHQEGWRHAVAILGDDLSMTHKPRVVLVEDATTRQKLMRGKASDAPFYDGPSRAIVCTPRELGDKVKASALPRLAVVQYMDYRYGGPTRSWLRSGLVQYVYAAVAFKGKPEKVAASELNKIRVAAEERQSTMPGLWDEETSDLDEDEVQVICCDLWGWHLFFRHAPEAAPWNERYTKSLDVLSETGDPAAARAVWEDVDGQELGTTYRKWIASWKP